MRAASSATIIAFDRVDGLALSAKVFPSSERTATIPFLIEDATEMAASTSFEMILFLPLVFF